MKIEFSKNYSVKLESHPWNINKYNLVFDKLLSDKIISKSDVVWVDGAKDEDILLVHTPDYVRMLKDLSLPPEEIARLELPLNKELVKFFWTFAQGTITASMLALEDGLSVHIGGGMHHAFPGYGSGFCMLNDIAIGVRKLQEDNLIKRALIVDCDLHQGDGTAHIFNDDKDVYTFSMHQLNNFPHFKQKSNLDIELDDGVEDGEYLSKLNDSLDRIFSEEERFDFIHYQAGADPYRKDMLGGLNISIEGLSQRDRIVISKARERNIPVAVTFGGGYPSSAEDLVNIHMNTVKVAAQSMKLKRKKV